MDISVKSNATHIVIQVKDISDSKIKEAINEALFVSGAPIEMNIKQECPVQTGRLRASIGHWTPGDLRAVNPKASDDDCIFELKKDVSEPSLTIGTNVEYAPYIHARNPYMTRGLLKSRDEIIRIFEETFKSKLK